MKEAPRRKAPFQPTGRKPADSAKGTVSPARRTTTVSEQKSTTASEQALSAVAGEAASVEKIRDILFGVQMRDYERKFARLEERLAKDTADLKEDVRKKLAALDVFLKQELESLSGRLKSEHEQRAAAVRELTNELKELKQALAQTAAQIEEQHSAAQREMRQQMLENYRTLSEEISQKADEAAASLQREAGELRLEKADRAALSSLFTEVALRLKDEFKIPGTERARGASAE